MRTENEDLPVPRGSRTLRDTLINNVGTGIAAGLAFACLLLAGRNLGPESFGLFALAIGILQMASELADLGLNGALIRHLSGALGVQGGDARSLIAVAFRLKIGAALLGGATLALLAGPLAASLGRPGLAPLLRWAALGLAGTVLVGVMAATLQAHQLFLRNAALGVAGWTLRLAGVTALVVDASMSPRALLVVFAVTPWLVAAGGLALLPRDSLRLRPWSRPAAATLVTFGRWMALSLLFSILLERSDVLLLGYLSTDRQVGLYFVARRIALLVTLLLNGYLMTLLPQLSRATNEQERKRILRTAVKFSVSAAAAIAAVTAISPWLVRPFGAAYTGAAPLVSLLLVGTLLRTLALPWNAWLFASNRPHIFALEHGLALALSCTANILLIPHYGAQAAAAIAATTDALILLIAFTATHPRTS